MYRACSTWQYEVVGHLLEQHLDGQRLGYVTGPNYAKRIRNRSYTPSCSDRKLWRVLKSHEGHRSFAGALAAGKALAVYTLRDLREVVFSLMHKRGVSFQELLRQGMIHQLLTNDRFWKEQPRVLVQRYEQLISDPVTGVVQIARHLGLGVTRREAAEIADEYSLESNRTRIAALCRRLRAAGIDLSDPANLQLCDPTTLLHWNHIGPGHSGTWRNGLSEREQTVLNRVCGLWLEMNGYERRRVGRVDCVSSRSQFKVLLGIELDMMIGKVAELSRETAMRFPQVACLIKQALGMQICDPGSLNAWSRNVNQGVNA
jgi:hypothetical protein